MANSIQEQEHIAPQILSSFAVGEKASMLSLNFRSEVKSIRREAT